MTVAAAGARQTIGVAEGASHPTATASGVPI